MNYQQTEPTEKTASNGTEAALLAEIIARMDKKDGTEKTAANPSAVLSINLVELFYFFLSKLHFVVLGTLLGAVLLGFYASSNITPIYTATSKLYIMGNTGASIIADLQIGSVLTMDYQEVFKTWEVHQMVNEELGTNYSYSALQSMISIANPADTRILYITAAHPDSQMAADIANAYASAAKRFIVQTMQTDEPSTFSIALVPGVAAGVRITSYVIRGALLGTVLVCGVLLLIFLLDNRPKSPEDIMRYANIPTLVVIPADPQLSGTNKHRKKGNKHE